MFAHDITKISQFLCTVWGMHCNDVTTHRVHSCRRERVESPEGRHESGWEQIHHREIRNLIYLPQTNATTLPQNLAFSVSLIRNQSQVGKRCQSRGEFAKFQIWEGATLGPNIYSIQCILLYPLVLCLQVTNMSLQAIHVDCSRKQFLPNPVNHAPSGIFKTLFLGMRIGDAAARMSTTKVAPEGIKVQECERSVVGVGLQSCISLRRMLSKRW